MEKFFIRECENISQYFKLVFVALHINIIVLVLTLIMSLFETIERTEKQTTEKMILGKKQLKRKIYS